MCGERVVYNCLRIGHSYPTHSYLLHKDPPPLCIPCHSPFSTEHILTESIDFQSIRVNYHSTSDISQLFTRFILLYYSIWNVSVCI